jgi:hypothetical protein
MKKIQSIQSAPNEPIKEIPRLNVDINGLEGLETKLKLLKLDNYKSKFIGEIQNVLSLYEDDELKYNYQFVEFIMCEVEKFILKKKSGQTKKQIVIEICKKYFNNDEKLVEMVINLVFHKLPQIKFFKRQGMKLVRFFFKAKHRQQ